MLNIYDRKIVYVLGSYPKIETFILNEMKELARIGFSVFVCPLYYIPPIDENETKWMPNVIYAESFNMLGIILSHLIFMLSKPLVYLRCLVRHKIYGGKLVFLKSIHFARVIKNLGIKHIHAHFGWTATDSARLISRFTDVSFSFSAHAADIYHIPDNLEEKLEEAKFVLTCVENNKTYINEKFGQTLGQKVHVVYHGVDLERFQPLVAVEKDIDILSIGNLVEKKGHRYLIKACSMLKKTRISLKCLIIGEGPKKEQLCKMIKELGLEKDMKIVNKFSQAELSSVYAKSKIFVLSSIITDSGDRDGIPNVLAEAMAIGLPVISSKVPNISELIENEKNGVLVSEKNPCSLANAIKRFLFNEELRTRIGNNAREKIVKDFDAQKHIRKIVDLFAAVV